jgi:hypothetical protein
VKNLLQRREKIGSAVLRGIKRKALRPAGREGQSPSATEVIVAPLPGYWEHCLLDVSQDDLREVSRPRVDNAPRWYLGLDIIQVQRTYQLTSRLYQGSTLPQLPKPALSERTISATSLDFDLNEMVRHVNRLKLPSSRVGKLTDPLPTQSVRSRDQAIGRLITTPYAIFTIEMMAFLVRSR